MEGIVEFRQGSHSQFRIGDSEKAEKKQVMGRRGRVELLGEVTGTQAAIVEVS